MILLEQLVDDVLRRRLELLRRLPAVPGVFPAERRKPNSEEAKRPDAAAEPDPSDNRPVVTGKRSRDSA